MLNDRKKYIANRLQLIASPVKRVQRSGATWRVTTRQVAPLRWTVCVQCVLVALVATNPYPWYRYPIISEVRSQTLKGKKLFVSHR